MHTSVDVVGIGGAGGFLAAALYRGGLSTRIISRGAALKQLRTVGLTIVTENKPTIYTPIESIPLDEVRQFAPVLLLTTKSYDVPALLEEMGPRIGPDTLLASVQNGFAAYDAIVSAFGPEQAVMGVLYVGASILSPGIIEVKPGAQQLLLGEMHSGQRTRLAPVVQALRAGGIESELVPDIERRMWMKQLFMVPFAIVNTETHLPMGKAREDPAARERWSALAREIASIAHASGTFLTADPAAASIAPTARFNPDVDSSFARDVWSHRPHEGEALLGPLLRRARQYEVDCPLLQEAYKHYVK